jgi:hypothetical protein
MAQNEANIGSQIIGALTALFDLMCEIHPEAYESLKAKAEQRNKELQEAQEAERLKSIAEAEEAYKSASEQKMFEELEGIYKDPAYESKSNLVKFPVTSNTDPDPEGEVA